MHENRRRLGRGAPLLAFLSETFVHDAAQVDFSPEKVEGCWFSLAGCLHK